MKIIFKIITLGALTPAASACSLSSSAGPDELEPTRLAVADSLARRVLAPTYGAAAEDLRALDVTVAAWSAAVASGGDGAAELAAARGAFTTAMDAWQGAEVLQLGPAGPAGVVIGGESLRDEVDSWPVTAPCQADRLLASEGYAAPDFTATALVNVRGLDVLELLLFREGTQNACDAADPINTDGTWQALDAAELVRRRAAYAAVLSAAVADVASGLASRWDADTGDFGKGLATAGQAGSPYPSGRLALDDVLGALLYVESTIKERKLAAAGPAEVESSWARRSKENVRANLLAVQQVVWGGPSAEVGRGFDDFLMEVGQTSVADDLNAALNMSLARVDEVEGTFADALAADPASLQPLSLAVSDLAAVLKGPVVVSLKLDPPGEGAGDAD